MVFEGYQFHQLPSQTGTIYFIILNVLILKKMLLLLYRNEVNSTANCTRIIYGHVAIFCVTVAKCVANAEGNTTDYQLRLNQSHFSI